MNNIRSRTIRFAHAHPNLRPHLLPLIRQAGLYDLLNVPGDGVTKTDLERAYKTFVESYKEALPNFTRFPGGIEAIAKLSQKDIYFTSTYAYLTFVNAGSYLQKLTQMKQVPRTYQRLFERAHRSFAKKTKAYELFYAKNQDIFQMLIDSIGWPDIQSTHQVGALRLINQAGINIDAVAKFVAEASQAIAESNLPRIKSILRGDVFVVGEIQNNKNVAAFYDRRYDSLFVLALPRFSGYELQVLIHEFGHRYWQQEVTAAVKDAWAIYHQQATSFPTSYARTNAEEHFCEALASYCLGKLEPPNANAFLRILMA